MDPFPVVRLAGDALDRCRRSAQQDLHGHRGLAGDPLYRARRTLHTGTDLLTDRQARRLHVLFAADNHVEVLATWGIYQRMIGAYRETDRQRGRQLMSQLIADLPTPSIVLSHLTANKETLDERPPPCNGEPCYRYGCEKMHSKTE